MSKGFDHQHDPSELERQARWNSKPRHVPHEGLSFEGDPGMTDPSFARDCDINNIMKTYDAQGIRVDLSQFHPDAVFGDTTLLPKDYQAAHQMVKDAEDAFMTLPAEARKQFGNDPARFVQFVENPANGPDLVRMGLATARATPPQPASPEPSVAAGGASEAKPKS